MNTRNRRRFCASTLATSLGAGLWAAGVRAQPAWPDRVVKLVVPFPPGGGTDSTARALAAKLTTTLGQTVVVENRVGAGGRIGTESVARAANDGYTLLLAPASYTVDPALHKLSYDPRKDLVPVSLVMSCPNILVVHPKAPFNTVREFLAYGKANPGKLTYASAGIGTGQHLSGELFNARTGANLLHVPYKGGGPALADLLGGQVSCYFANAGSATVYVKDGRLKALGVTSSKRSPQLPAVPTLMEQGVPNYDVLEWAGVFVPAGTSQAIIDRLVREVKVATDDPDVRAKFAALGVEPAGTTQAEFTSFVDAQIRFWTDLVKANNIKAE